MYRMYRKLARMSAITAARLLNCSPDCIWAYENGNRRCPAEMAERMAEVYGAGDALRYAHCSQCPIGQGLMRSAKEKAAKSAA